MRLLILIIYLQLAVILNGYAVVYVDSSATGVNDGTSWADAFVYLQDAINSAVPGDTIWVAKGTYYPDEGDGYLDDQRNYSFVPEDSVVIYGGFNGTETQLNQRDWVSNKTVLSGEIQQDGDSTNNTFLIVECLNLSEQTLIDGITITGAYNDSLPTPTAGGMKLLNANISVTNVVVRNNFCEVDDVILGESVAVGGILIVSSNPKFDNISIIGNSAFSELDYSHIVGGIYSTGSMMELVNSNVYGNSSKASGLNSFAVGGAFFWNIGKANITNTSFINNNSEIESGENVISTGGIVNAGTNMLLSNVNICNNYGLSSPIADPTYAVGGITNYLGNTTLTNVTLSNNRGFTSSEASYGSGAMLNDQATLVEINNCIFWQNQGNGGLISHKDIVNNVTMPTATNSLFEEFTEGNDCIVGQNPQFKLAGSVSSVSDGGAIGDFRLQAGSPAINMGLSSLLPNDTNDIDNDADISEPLPLDLYGFPRVSACEVDMGSHEYQSAFTNGVAGDTAICYTEPSIELIGFGDSLLWYADTGLTILVGSGDTLFETGGAGVYTYYITDSIVNCPRQIADTVLLIINDLPTPDLGKDTRFCPGDSVELNSGSFEAYQWNTADTIQSIYVSLEGSYNVLVTDTNGCQNSDTIMVSESPIPFPDLGNDTAICEDATLTLFAGSYENYEWHDSSTDSIWFVDANQSGIGNYTYYVEVTDSNGCSNIDSIAVEIINCTGMNEGGQAFTFSVYPNPSNSEFVIELDESVGQVRITILNLEGREVYGEMHNEKRIQLDFFQPSGVYLLLLESQKWKNSLKIVKE